MLIPAVEIQTKPSPFIESGDVSLGISPDSGMVSYLGSSSGWLPTLVVLCVRYKPRCCLSLLIGEYTAILAPSDKNLELSHLRYVIQKTIESLVRICDGKRKKRTHGLAMGALHLPEMRALLLSDRTSLGPGQAHRHRHLSRDIERGGCREVLWTHRHGEQPEDD